MGEIPYKIEDIVAVAETSADIPLEKLVSHKKGSTYDAEHLPGVVYSIPGRKSTALVFSSGKIVCTGCSCIKEAEESINEVISKIKEIGVDVPQAKVEIEKIVALTRLKNKLNIGELSLTIKSDEYSSGQMPGLVYRCKDPEVNFLIMESGRIICSGAKSIADLEKALLNLRDKLSEAGVRAEFSA